MATATYNEKTQTWILNCTDLAKKAKGEKDIYFKRKKKDKAYPTMSKRDRIARMAQMQNLAEEYEQATKVGVYTHDEMQGVIDAVEYLTNSLTDDMIVGRGSQEFMSEKKRQLSIFVSWLSENYKGIYLHQINNDVAKAYLRHVGTTHAYGTVKARATNLSFIFGRIREKFEDYDSDYNYKNPFGKASNLPRMDYSRVQKEGFTMEEMKRIITATDDEYMQLLIKLGFILGNRFGDILKLKFTPDSIDLNKRIITIRQQKTKNHKTVIQTKVFITDSLMALLKPYYRKGEYLFSVWNFSKGEPQQGTPSRAFRAIMAQLDMNTFEKKGKKEVYHYSFHCLRGTCITELKKAMFNNDLIDYYVGHRGRGIDAAHYNKFGNTPQESTESMVNCLMGLLD